MYRKLAAALVAVAVARHAVAAQVVSLDEGTFVIVRDGETVGREDFSIRSTLSSGVPILVAQGRLTLGERRVSPSLNADTTGYVLRYQTEVRMAGRVVETYSGQSTRDHYSARVMRPDGESAREFRLPAGAVAVDDEIVHQLWFITRRGPGAAVVVLVPGRNVVETVRVESVGPERLTFDIREFETRHLRLRTDGTGVTRDVWVDSAGKMLKVVIPSQRLVAVRDEIR